MIRLIDITKIYKSNDNEQIALDHINLLLPDKGFISICGASGCGKTTLLNILGGLDKPNEGKLIVNNKDTSLFNENEWDSYRNQEVGFVFQQYYLLPHLNVFENIALTLQMMNDTKDVQKRVDDVLDKVGLKSSKKKYPRQLSGGEMQRVAIARAIIANPSIVLADEPTGALDQKNAEMVMNILKDISKDHLVVLVTHNEQLAKDYSDHIVNISYGKIINEINIKDDNTKEKNALKKVHLPFSSIIKWAGKNLIKKKSRSIPLIIASAIGLASVGIITSYGSGLSSYTVKVQKESLGEYPLYFTSYHSSSKEAKEEQLEEYPDIDKVIIEKDEPVEYVHFNSFSDDFMKYMDNMPASYYSYKDSNTVTNFPLFTKNGDNYQKVNSSSYFTKIANSEKEFGYLKNQYDLLEGEFVDLTRSDECLLVVDKYNRINENKLKDLGFSTEGDSIKYSDIVGKEYYVLSNDLVYEKKDLGDGNFKYVTATFDPNNPNYDLSKILTLKIKGIVREKMDADSKMFSTGIIYSPALMSYVKNSAAQSEIVKDQLKYGLTKDVFTGEPFMESSSSSSIISVDYQYEYRLIILGYSEAITVLYFYTDTFETRTRIMEYFNEYQIPKNSGLTIRSKDYLEQVTSAFSGLINTLVMIILFFAFASVLVASILTAILTYISVLERNKEIGLLRSLGARKKDVSLLFIAEASVIGLVAAILAIILVLIILPIGGSVIIDLNKAYGYKAIQPTLSDIATFQLWLIPTTFVGSIIVSILSSLIPALIAGNKKPAEVLKE